MRVPRPVQTFVILGLVLLTFSLSYAQARYRLYLPAVVTQSTGSSIPPTPQPPTPVPPSPTPLPQLPGFWMRISSNTSSPEQINFSGCNDRLQSGSYICFYSTERMDQLQNRGMMLIPLQNGRQVTLSPDQLATWSNEVESYKTATMAIRTGEDPEAELQMIPAPRFPFDFGDFAGQGWVWTTTASLTPLGWVVVVGAGGAASVAYLVVAYQHQNIGFTTPVQVAGAWHPDNIAAEAQATQLVALAANAGHGSMEDGIRRTEDQGGQINRGDPRCKPRLDDGYTIEIQNQGEVGRNVAQLIDPMGNSVGFASSVPMQVMDNGVPITAYQISGTVIQGLNGRGAMTALGRILADEVVDQLAEIGGEIPRFYTVASNPHPNAWHCLTGPRQQISANGSLWDFERYQGAPDFPDNINIRRL